jgi:hypothetical protein
MTDQGVIAIRGRGTATVRWRECRGSERVCQCATVMSVRKLEEDSPKEALQHIAAPVMHRQTWMILRLIRRLLWWSTWGTKHIQPKTSIKLRQPGD